MTLNDCYGEISEVTWIYMVFAIRDMTQMGQADRRIVEVQRNTGKGPRKKVMSMVATKQEENKETHKGERGQLDFERGQLDFPHLKYGFTYLILLI